MMKNKIGRMMKHVVIRVVTVHIIQINREISTSSWTKRIVENV